MHTEQREKTHALLQEKGISQALFARSDSVKWLTGYASPVQTGPVHFESGPPAVWYEDGHYTLIVVDTYADLAAPFNEEKDGTVATYLGYTIEQPIESGKHEANIFQEIIKNASGGKIGVELGNATAMMLQTIGENREITAIDGWLKPLRMVKTSEELEKLKANFALTDLGHAVARETIAPGKTEIEVWGAIHSAIETKAGCRVPFGNDCVVSSRSPNNIGGWPLDHEITPGHSLVLDLSTIMYGYWSDSCATYYVSERTQQQKKMHQTVLDALELGISLLRPGAVAKDIDQKIRGFIADAGFPVYPHHTGHGIGVSGHEAPRIVPYSEEVLEEGMVILLEPGIYFPGEAAVRVEDAMLITSDGCELLTFHDKS